MCKEAGRPWPVIVPEDDVLDYMVMEAVAIRVRREEQEAEEQRKRNDWKKKEAERIKQLV